MQLQTNRTIIAQFPQHRCAGDNLLPSRVWRRFAHAEDEN